VYFGSGARKFFADMIESVLGGIFMDSLANLEMCENFLKRIGLVSILTRLLEDGVDCSHPKSRLGVLAASRRVVYHTSQTQDKRWASFVVVGDEATGIVAMGFSRDEAETRAAAAACEMLDALREDDETAEMDLNEAVLDEADDEGTHFDLEVFDRHLGNWKY
jgi:dsRNA-specific ribonuclease